MNLFTVEILSVLACVIFADVNDDPFAQDREVRFYTDGVINGPLKRSKVTVCACGQQEGYSGPVKFTNGHCHIDNNTDGFGTCLTPVDGACILHLSQPEKDNDLLIRRLGCTPKLSSEDQDQSYLGTKLMCMSAYRTSFRFVQFCCNNEPMCNLKINRTLRQSSLTSDFNASDGQYLGTVITGWQIVLFVFCGVLVVIVITFGILILRQHRSAKNGSNVGSTKDRENGPLISQQPDVVYGLSEMVDDMLGYEHTSGSGSGLPLLAQRTLARQITLEDKIGEGSFGFVHRGRWRGEYVAVKIFQSKDEDSWYNESRIYQVCYLRHEHILGFFAADTKDARFATELWLVVEYHHNGSLYDYLKTHTVSINTMFKMVQGIAAGLSHLHMDICGTLQKPLLAHRDLKSKNIFVKNDLTCCIGDMGLAATFDNSKNPSIQLPKNGARCGTIRYQAPEILSLDHSELTEFETLQRGDIYSTGLVMWEVMRRMEVNGLAESFEVAFYEYVTQDPSNDDMYKLVGQGKKRPTISNRWTVHPALSEMCLLIRECWADNPYARLSALRVKKTITELRIKMGDDCHNNQFGGAFC